MAKNWTPLNLPTADRAIKELEEMKQQAGDSWQVTEEYVIDNEKGNYWIGEGKCLTCGFATWRYGAAAEEMLYRTGIDHYNNGLNSENNCPADESVVAERRGE